ncbi:hypothetical protein OBK30_12810 [Empedobacter falsenii]
MHLDFISKLYYEGQSNYIDTIKRLLYKKDSSIFQKLDFYKNEIYLNPLLFSFFTLENYQLNITLDQILYSDLPVNSKLNVNSDKYGIIYLSGYGYLLNVDKNTKFIFDKNKFKLYTLGSNVMVNYDYKPLNIIDNANIELSIYSNPYLEKLIESYIQNSNNFSKHEHIYLVNKHKNDIKKALNIIEEVIPDFYKLILDSTKNIFLYENQNIRSFVTRKCHGTIFLSVDDKSNITYFLEEIIHQCGHNIFNSVTFNVNEFIQISENTNLGSLIKNNDSRTIYDALHGVFTVSTGTQILYEVYNKIDLGDDELNKELLARLAIKSKRFRTGIERIRFNEIFTEKGKIIYDILDKKCEQIITNNKDIFNKFNFSNQPPVFSYEMFKKVN